MAVDAILPGAYLALALIFLGLADQFEEPDSLIMRLAALFLSGGSALIFGGIVRYWPQVRWSRRAPLLSIYATGLRFESPTETRKLSWEQVSKIYCETVLVPKYGYQYYVVVTAKVTNTGSVPEDIRIPIHFLEAKWDMWELEKCLKLAKDAFFRRDSV